MFVLRLCISFLIIVADKFVAADINQVVDICSILTKRIYLPVDSRKLISTWEIIPENDTISECKVELVTCSACTISIKIYLWDLSRNGEASKKTSKKGENGSDLRDNDRIEITEPAHRIRSKQTFHVKHINNLQKILYKSLTKSVVVHLFYSPHYEHSFSVECTAKYNVQNFEISPGMDSLEGVIESPFFPLHYPFDYRSQYNIKCSKTLKKKCRIKLIFSDYQLAPQSLLEFFENKHHRLGITTGRQFRPPVMISNGRTLCFNFYANKASGFGFRVKYIALIGNKKILLRKPRTVCGGYVKNSGGAIVMNKMTPSNKTIQYDCIWIVRPNEDVLSFKTHLFLKITRFQDMGPDSKIEIFRGVTSSHRKLETIEASEGAESISGKINRELTAHINTGFYISLRGTFSWKSELVISYATFSLSQVYENGIDSKMTSVQEISPDCNLQTDFLCNNHKCIVAYLHCDGYDHCGDNSDEIYDCVRGEKDKKMHMKNYYFPNSEESRVPAGFVIVFFTSFVTSLFCILCYTLVQKMDQDDTSLQNTDRLADGRETRNRSFISENANIEDTPPEYECPPNYDDIIEMEIILNNQRKRMEHRTPSSSPETAFLLQNESIMSHSVLQSNSNSIVDGPATPVEIHSYTCSYESSKFFSSPDSCNSGTETEDFLIESSCLSSHQSSDLSRTNSSTGFWNFGKKQRNVFSRISTTFVSSSKSMSNLMQDFSNSRRNRLSQSADILGGKPRYTKVSL